MTEKNDIVMMTAIGKSFPGVKALKNVDFNLKAGEIHALVGENGAGKSTLIKVLTGIERHDQGTIVFDGKEIMVTSTYHAHELGISTVYQEINLCPNLTVAENIMIGREPRKWGSIDWKAVNKQAAEVLQGLGISIDVTQLVGSYSIAIQQMTAIARALEISSVKVLILDEPTSSLDTQETQQLFRVMDQLKRQGIAIIFITHFLDQIYEISDRITVLRNGEWIGTYQTVSLSRLELISNMIGRNLDEYENMEKIKIESSQHIKKEILLDAKALGLSGSIKPFDLELHGGEVLGLAGLLGSGRTEIARLLFGVDQPDSGSINMTNRLIKDFSPLESIGRRIGLCPEDRKAEGLVGELTIRENIILALQANQGYFKYLSRKTQYEIANKYIKLLKIATPSADQIVNKLSGGNQQKVILARWLATNPQILILDEPTRGIDIGTKAEIQKLVLSLAEKGKACIFISSELEEVMRTSHRIMVLRDQQIIKEFSGAVEEQSIMKIMAGSEE